MKNSSDGTLDVIRVRFCLSNSYLLLFSGLSGVLSGNLKNCLRMLVYDIYTNQI